MSVSIARAAELLVEGKLSGSTLAPLSETLGSFTADEAYAIQDRFRAELARRGQQSIGWKLAATGPTGQAPFGINEPISGFLFPETYRDGDAVSAKAFNVVYAEAEIAFRMGRDLRGPGVSMAQAKEAVEGAIGAIELADSPYTGKPNITDVIAAAALGKAILLGREAVPLSAVDLARESVVFEHNGERVSANEATEVMGHPLNALAWLANHLALRGISIKRGDLVMSGAISKLLRLQMGETISAKFSGLGNVACHVIA